MSLISKTFVIFMALVNLVQAKKMIVIDLSAQEAYAYENDSLIMSGEVSTGKVGHRTPTGRFKILQKKKKHVSSKYPEPNGGARMDYMMRLTNSGIAMHLGYVPNYPASHGCIRLKNGFAQKLYRWARVGTPVVIKGKAPVRVSRNKKRKAPKPPKVEPLGAISSAAYYPEDTLEFHQPARRVKKPREVGYASADSVERNYYGANNSNNDDYDDLPEHSYSRERSLGNGFLKDKPNTRGFHSKYIYEYHNGKRYRRRVIELDDFGN
jgi:hypothetical protein